MQVFKRWIRRWRHGPPLVVVSGLPRSGTSLLMQMLDAGGWPVVTDAQRQADTDNPKGYYELERVKELDKSGDKSWLRAHRGQAIKIVSHFLVHLPHDLNYRVLFVLRDLDEILMSQRKMLQHRGEAAPGEAGDSIKQRFDWHLRKSRYLLREQPNMEVLYLNYQEVVGNPQGEARRIERFLGGGLKLSSMESVVDSQLYRNRREPSAARPS